MRYTYYRASDCGREQVEFPVKLSVETTCVVDVQMLLMGIRTFPCSSGDDYRLSKEEAVEIAMFVRSERAKYTQNVGVKTLDMWRETKLGPEDYFEIGDIVAEDVVDELVNNLTPTLNRSCCTQLGETYSSARRDDGGYESTYVTFHRVEKGKWQFDGYCFYGENVNRNVAITSVERFLMDHKSH